MILERGDAGIHFDVAGAGPAILFAHGLGGNHLSWWQQVPHFAPRHTCVTFAHRGFYPSSAATGAPVASAFAGDIGALLDRLQIDRAVLVCQSMGGWGGLAFALEHPQRVSALVMACTSGAVDYHGLPGLERHWLQAWEEKARRAAVELPKRGASPAAGERMAREQPALHGLYAGISALTPPDFRDQVRREIIALRHHSPEILSRLRMPVLYLEGEEDLVFPPAAGPALAALTPKGRHASVPESGHSVYFERAERFNRLVDEFLDASR